MTFLQAIAPPLAEFPRLGQVFVHVGDVPCEANEMLGTGAGFGHSTLLVLRASDALPTGMAADIATRVHLRPNSLYLN